MDEARHRQLRTIGGIPDCGPLSGIFVADFGTHAVGAVTSSYLAMLGATVLKIEAIDGDPARRVPPLIGGMSLALIGNNQGKLGITLDLKDASDLRTAKAILAEADVLVENRRSPEVLERRGLGVKALHQFNPGLVYLASGGFGSVGPMKGMGSAETAAQASGGFVSVTGAAGGEAEFSRATAHMDWNGAMLNVVAVLAGLAWRQRTGRGLFLEGSQFRSSTFLGLTRLAEGYATGQSPRPMGSARPNLCPDEAFESADGYVTVSVPGEKFWPRLCAALERADLLADERFATNRSRIEHREALIAELRPVFRGASSDHWIELLQRADVPCARSHRPQMLSQVMRAHPQVRANEMLVDRSSQWGRYQSSAPHWQFEKTPVVIPRAAPALGEHNEALLGAQGVFARDSLEEPQPREAEGAAADEAPALDGLRVIELAEGVPGPLCGFLLAQLGAEVVKVEPPGGDWMRDVPPGDEGESALFAALNSGKQGRVIDLQTAAGRDELRSLTAEADVAVVGYRPHKLERLGIAYEQLRAENGRLIYCQISGAGTEGPWADHAITELDVQEATGINYTVGYREGPPTRLGYDVASMATGVAATQATLAALLWRDHAGAGQRVSVSLLQTAIAMTQLCIASESESAERLGRYGGAAYDWAPEHGFALADMRCLIGLGNEEAWREFVALAGGEHLLEDERFHSLQQLNANGGALPDLLEKYTRTLSYADVEAFVRKLGRGQVGPVFDINTLLHHPQFKALRIADQSTGKLVMRFPFDTVPPITRDTGEAPALDGRLVGRVRIGGAPG